MRWKIVAWVSTALSTMCCAQLMAIDHNIHLDGSVVTVSTPPNTDTNFKESDGLLRQDSSDVSEHSSSEIEPEVNSPETEPGNTSPETDPGNNSSENEPENNIPDTESGNQSPEIDSDNNSAEADPGNNSPELNPENNSPEIDAGHNSPEIDSGNNSPEIDQENNSPEIDTGDTSPENTPETEPDDNSPESNPEDNSPEPEAGDSSPETDPGDNSPEPGTGSSGSAESLELSELGEVLRTEHGLVQGYKRHGALGIQSFIDIPYGKFTGLFGGPQQPEPWEYVHTAMEHNKRCPQWQYPDTYIGDLDCLTLSVFAPSNVTNAAVLFHIHDGSFISGSADPSIYGPEYLVTKGVILVLPNYRLGPLGFLCLQNETAPGNAALKDLTLALNWTKNNIEAFGGSADKIVVSGDGTSGALVGYLALSPKAREYISGAITESGSVLSHWTLDRNPIETATNLAEALRASIREELNNNNVFQGIDARTLVTHAKDTTFKPCIEDGTEGFINKTPWRILHEEKIEIPFMIGSANKAGMQEALGHTTESVSQLNQDFSILFPNDLEFRAGAAERSEVAERVKRQYFEEESVSLNNLDRLSLCYTDISYISPALRSARPLVEAGATVYFYEFSFVGDLNRVHNALTTPLHGAARGDIAGYVFTQDGETPHENTDEERMVNIMTDLWVSFIQTGKPSANNVEWNDLKNVEDSEEEWLSIGSDVKLEKGLHLSRTRLWTQIYNDHFVEPNLALELKPSISYVLFTSIVLFISRLDFRTFDH